MFLKILIVAKCIVNGTNASTIINDLAILIVAKCIVNDKEILEVNKMYIY